MSAPPQPPKDPRIERILLQTVPWEARQKGGSLLQDCLRDLWESAVNIGFNYGDENLARAREEGFREGKEVGFREGVESRSESEIPEASKAAVLHEQALEVERVWGYDIGWKLGCELHQSRASPPTPTPAPLDWAEDAAGLPTLPLQAESPPSTLRDFSALFTGSLQPFASLQRRRRRSPRPATSSSPQNHSMQKQYVRRPQKRSTIRAAPRRTPPSYSHPPPSISFRTPTSFPPSDKPAAQFPLDWDQDPRLRDLSQALAALGWVRS
ncbi:hypothetical protein B0H12DRAFT_1068914 [Mycena haematopus]|nr:hypothetical protein B0H12DRAFT_1068914 [Mycena haematopus]